MRIILLSLFLLLLLLGQAAERMPTRILIVHVTALCTEEPDAELCRWV